MSTYNFFKNCLLETEKIYNTLLKTPRARASRLQSELCEIMAKLNTALEYGEITPAQALELKKEFMKFNFSDISEARAASKQSQKMKQI